MCWGLNGEQQLENKRIAATGLSAADVCRALVGRDDAPRKDHLPPPTVHDVRGGVPRPDC
eukprot:scaffold427_cov103-Alexandrium_tamarense.AAC.11